MNKYLDPNKYVIYISLRLSKLISYWEKENIEKYSRIPLKHQPVFIIGAPRTGSTILYQILTNQLDVIFVNNLTCILHKNFFYGFWLSNKLFKQKPHNNFKSFQGDTSKFGLRSPSECGAYWYRWLSKDHHFIDYPEINDEMVNQIRDEITAVINYFNKPIVFKNLNAGQRIRLLSKCFPNAKFIFIKRDPLYTAQSIIISKKKLGMKSDEFWSIMPKNVNQLKKLSSAKQIVQQIFFIEKQINEDQKLVKKENFWIIQYEEMTNSKFINRAKDFIGVPYRKNAVKYKVNIRNKIKLNAKEIESLSCEIKKMDWNTYEFKQD